MDLCASEGLCSKVAFAVIHRASASGIQGTRGAQILSAMLFSGTGPNARGIIASSVRKSKPRL